MVVYHDRNLIINYIPRNLSDVDLSILFATVGAIKTCKIIRDHNSGSSFGFGFCEYEDAESAHRAIERFNGYRIGDKILKVSLAKLQGRLYQSSNLYVKNFPLSVTDEEIAEKFSRFGTVLQCRILRDRETNASRGSAYVLFDNRIEAEAAKRNLDGVPWPGSSDGQPLAIKFATPPYRQPATTQGKSDHSNNSQVSSSSNNLIENFHGVIPNLATINCGLGQQYFPESYGITNPNSLSTQFGLQSSPNPSAPTWIPDYSTESVAVQPFQITPAYFPQYVLPSNPMFPAYWQGFQPNTQSPYGLLYGPQVDGITNAVHGFPVLTGIPNNFNNNGYQNSTAMRGFLSGLLADETSVRKLKNNKNDKTNLASVYVYNIGNLMSERRLSELFSRFGNVVNVSIPRDPKTNFTRNFGFVNFNSMHCAQLAINSMNGFVYDGKRLQVSLRKPRSTINKNHCTANTKLMSGSQCDEASPYDIGESEQSPGSTVRDTNLDVSTLDACAKHLDALQINEVSSSQNHVPNGRPPSIPV